MNAPRTRVVRRPVHGVLLLDKPLGLSSNNALQKCKWLVRAEKAGHTGTLDPLATGVLPLCFGAATKFSQMHLDADKTYEAVARLGQKTTTGDAEGEVTVERPVGPISARQLAEVALQFTGAQLQMPPMYSALKKDGKPLYEYARAGEEVSRTARHIVIYELNLALESENRAWAAIKIIAKVSKGTYIRTLGEDIGEALGCGAHLVSLRRVATGNFSASQCVTLEALEAMTEAQRLACLHPVEALLPGHQRVTLDADNAARFLSGLRRRGDWPDNEHICVRGPMPPTPENRQAAGEASPGNPAASVLLGTGHVKAGELIPGRLLSPLEIQQILEA